MQLCWARIEHKEEIEVQAQEEKKACNRVKARKERLPRIDGFWLQISKPFFDIALQELGKISHTNIIMIYLKKVKKVFKIL